MIHVQNSLKKYIKCYFNDLCNIIIIINKRQSCGKNKMPWTICKTITNVKMLYIDSQTHVNKNKTMNAHINNHVHNKIYGYLCMY